MELFGVPHGWVKVEEEDFEAYLKTCNDYVKISYNWTVYEFRHNGERFAYASKDGVWVSPKILKL
jgi:hypothetical protein